MKVNNDDDDDLLLGGRDYSNQNLLMMSYLQPLPSGKLIWQWKINLLKMYYLLNMGIFQPAMLVYQRVFLARVTPSLRVVVSPKFLPSPKLHP